MRVTIDSDSIKTYFTQSFIDTILPHWRIIASCAIGLVIFFVWVKTAKILGPYLTRRTRKISCLLISSPGFLVLISIWGDSLPNLGAYIAIIAAGCTFALNVPLSNIACWFVLSMKKPLKIGEIFEIGDQIGEVLAISPQTVTMLEYVDNGEGIQTTGVVFCIPNKTVLESKIVHLNSNGNMKLVEFSATFTIDSDLMIAKDLMLAACNSEGIFKENLKIHSSDGLIKEISQSKDIEINLDFLDHGFKLYCLCWVDSKSGRKILSEARANLLLAIRREKRVELAYPTYRIEGSFESTKDELSMLNEQLLLDEISNT